ncbi:hypothetical protein QFC19_004197 [Naganishia cerealis]|uniref:Uncharacterized protein n=1 Tax=Naganishia cerealis TaxID=610337 RepID=A0ACC2VZ00_9TREE|nr:hypothetical protein QFC19_004197 [Naganishia cerealis]
MTRHKALQSGWLRRVPGQVDQHTTVHLPALEFRSSSIALPNMLLTRCLTALVAIPLLAHAANRDKFVELANKSKDGIITLNSALYDEILAPDVVTSDGAKGRDYAVAVVLTALPAQMNCAPCRTFDPIFKQEAANWKRLPKEQRDDMFFAVLDFTDGQQVFQKVRWDLRNRCRAGGGDQRVGTVI